MTNNLIFEQIDVQKWERTQHFYYFTQMTNIGFTINAEINVTSLRCALKEKGLKFYPAYLWLVTTVLNRHKEFRTAICNGQVGYWSSLTPAYAIFHEDDKTFSYLWTEYNDYFKSFYQTYLDDISKYGQNHGILAKPDPMPNSYTISMIPWISFTGLTIHSYKESEYYFPIVEAGKFFERDSQIIMPISITSHHAVCDGYHVGLIINDIQKFCNEANNWID